MTKYLTVKDINIYKQRILLRADLNVPILNNTIIDDYRLHAILPTIDYLLHQQTHIVLITHLGKPKGIEKSLSTHILVPWFQNKGYSITFAPDINTAYQLSQEKINRIVLVENLRFFAGEQQSDSTFAQQLATLGDIFVNDAFGTLHRNDSSIVLTPSCFAKNKRCIGLLVAKELSELEKLFFPKKPFTLILGGGKPKTKIPLIINLLDKTDYVLLCPALAFTFLAAQDIPVGASLIDSTLFNDCLEIIKKTKQTRTQLIFPMDYMVSKNKLNPPYRTITIHNFESFDSGVSIGPKTIEDWEPIINKSKTIFFNGLMGDLSIPESTSSSMELFKVITQSNGFSVIAGGDSVAAAIKGGFEKKISYLSTGGGATLAYLAGQELPGLNALRAN
ncbi:MAG: phosphoglycerate kinase [Candidatus Dependentiae bacterium]